jgi:hypothetical protein
MKEGFTTSCRETSGKLECRLEWFVECWNVFVDKMSRKSKTLKTLKPENMKPENLRLRNLETQIPKLETGPKSRVN